MKIKNNKKDEVVDKTHGCVTMVLTNIARRAENEPPVNIKKDEEGWFLYASSEFFNVGFCPFCGESLL